MSQPVLLYQGMIVIGQENLSILVKILPFLQTYTSEIVFFS